MYVRVKIKYRYNNDLRRWNNANAIDAIQNFWLELVATSFIIRSATQTVDTSSLIELLFANRLLHF